MATNTHCSAQFSIIINKIDIACVYMQYHTMLYILRTLSSTEIASKSLNSRLRINLLNLQLLFPCFSKNFSLSLEYEVRFVFYIVNPSFPSREPAP